jgi:hypothetical protein
VLPLAFIALLEVHGPDGQTAYVNEHEISTLREPAAHDLRHFARGTHCIVVTTNGKFVATVETCATLRQRLTYP